MPQLENPNNHLEPLPGGSSSGDQDGDDLKMGAYSDHSQQIGRVPYKEVTHVKQPTVGLQNELVQENKLIRKEQLDMSLREQVEETTLDGLFSTRYKDSSVIQPKPIVPNFFNPYRLIDQVLFKEKEHTYMNCSIFRDVSGSTHGSCHTLMEHVTAQLMKDIPIDVKYYLYASGQISVVEVPYIPWLDNDKAPKEYTSNPLYQQLSGGTNSDAIADVITEQMSDKWLNIIVTDGDLHQLLRRDNIAGLLKNVFVIAVETKLEDISQAAGMKLLGVEINSTDDLKKINSVLSTINMV